ncbi:DUF500-domain-containing protein [Dothidotthia symphoricarpi CBS 119687]|uniref:DUF500-domain-containing protein n=1 Tax=Dothidotthia symphoricarpi CBS 119687 TaxID=1392245 RepID=A0A6A6A9U2_9PLEO|nr:DUF500-domain-containing protein [Dothidotthia symphoricarpi CBS 119687]KAF2127945.1 DUF500-domain-containing protein [Dothidotthia symphoricarpi CBS 119687]
MSMDDAEYTMSLSTSARVKAAIQSRSLSRQGNLKAVLPPSTGPQDPVASYPLPIDSVPLHARESAQRALPPSSVPVPPPFAMWSRTKTQSKAGFDKVYNWVDKAGAPVNRWTNKVGSEAFWPTTLDLESDKAARILKTFCKEGFYQEEDRLSADGPTAKQKVLKTIPAEIIKNAVGLCIFTTMRTGMWVSGSGGSGVLVARKEDGSWSPPSGIQLQTLGLGFLVGIDIYDCVIVINSAKALEGFKAVRCTLGGELSATAGPVGIGGSIDMEVHKLPSPVYTYMKSRGFYAGVELAGTVVIERTDENARFYGEPVRAQEILTGNVHHAPFETRRLLETLRAAQGDTDIDESLMPNEASPGDFEITAPEEKVFGVPEPEDPDPFGVLALQNAGLDIVEAGTHKRPSSEQFEFKPSPTSPVYSNFRKSMDNRSSLAPSRRSSWRISTISSVLGGRSSTSTMVDMCTQTDSDLEPSSPVKTTPPALPPRQSMTIRTPSPPLADIPEAAAQSAMPQPEEMKDGVVEEKISSTTSSPRNSKTLDDVKVVDDDENDEDDDEDEDEDDSEDDDEEEEVVIQEVHQAAAPQAITRARVIQVAKPVAPVLPVRNPFRNRASVISQASNGDASVGVSSTTEKRSPVSTPSLKHSNSTSSLSSVEDSLQRVSNKLQPKYTNEAAPEQASEEKFETFHSPPITPMQHIPGGFE